MSQTILLGEIGLIGRDIKREGWITWVKWPGFGKMSWCGLNVLAKCSASGLFSSVEAKVAKYYL